MHVAERLRHLAPVAVDDEAVGQHALVGRRVARADRLEQRGVEPAAVLVGALEVELGRPAQLGARLEHGGVAAARVEPDVEDVGLLAEALAAALRAARARGQELARGARVPLVGAVASRKIAATCSTSRSSSRSGLAARAVERDDRHAPDALARDAPVRAVRDHVVDALLAPAAGSSWTSRCDRRRARARAGRRWSSAMNHCSVARKSVGFLQRQQCG